MKKEFWHYMEAAQAEITKKDSDKFSEQIQNLINWFFKNAAWFKKRKEDSDLNPIENKYTYFAPDKGTIPRTIELENIYNFLAKIGKEYRGLDPNYYYSREAIKEFNFTEYLDTIKVPIIKRSEKDPITIKATGNYDEDSELTDKEKKEYIGKSILMDERFSENFDNKTFFELFGNKEKAADFILGIVRDTFDKNKEKIKLIPKRNPNLRSGY